MGTSHGRAVQDVTATSFEPRDVMDGRWRIVRQLAQGAMGTVYLAVELATRRRVAIKTLNPDLGRNPKLVARFEREIRLMASVRHSNVIRLHAVGRRGAFQFVVMDYLDGATLAAVLAHAGRFAPREALALLRPVCAGLESLHSNGLVHRDLKPANIFVARDGHVTILDLGLALRPSEPSLTRPGSRVGTPWYMSPEQVLGRDTVDARADIYALGVIAFELLTGRIPFQSLNHHEVLRAHLEQAPPDPRDLTPTLPRAATAVITRAMAKRPEERFASVQAFSVALEDALTATEPMKLGDVTRPLHDDPTLPARPGDETVTLGRYASEVLGPVAPEEPLPEAPRLLSRAAAALRRLGLGPRRT